MSIGKPIHHQINYIEFNVLDMQKTKDFYQNIFGWEFTDYSPGYVGIKSGEFEVGGFSLAEEVKPGGPLIVLYSENLEESFHSVAKANGEITKEIFKFPGGRRFEFLDPNGHEMAVWSDK